MAEKDKRVEGLPCALETHIHDLPDECLIQILHGVGSPLLKIRTAWHEDTVVQHLLQCALICKRWRSLVDAAVRSLSLDDMDNATAREVARRFDNLTTFAVNYSRCVGIVELARLTPQLQNLKLYARRNPHPIPEIPEAMSMWTNLMRVDLTRFLYYDPPGKCEPTFSALRQLPSLQHLSLGNACSASDGLQSICTSIDMLTGLTRVDLRCRSFPEGRFCSILQELVVLECSSVPNSLLPFSRLESLTLHCLNTLTALPESFGCLSRLTSLEVIQGSRQGTTDKYVSFWPQSLTNLRSLQRFGLVPFTLSWVTVPQSIGCLSELRSLRLSPDRRLPEGVWDLPLRELELRGGRLSKLPSSLGRLSRIEMLRMNYTPDTVCLPGSLGMLTTLREFEIEGCNCKNSDCRNCGLEVEADRSGSEFAELFETLPDSIGRLTRLEVCKLSRRPLLVRLPDSISQWHNLAKLEIMKCEVLMELPEGLGELGSLEEMKIEDCSRLISLPRSVGGLSRLRVFCLRKCPCLVELPGDMGMLTGLKTLEMERCGEQIEALPERLGGLTALRTCKIGGLPSLLLLPESMGDWCSLRSLVVSACESLKEFQEAIGQLITLEELEIRRCSSLVSLPRSLGSLSRLRLLHVSECGRLTKWPETVEDLRALETLQVYRCNVLEPLPESLKRVPCGVIWINMSI